MANFDSQNSSGLNLILVPMSKNPIPPNPWALVFSVLKCVFLLQNLTNIFFFHPDIKRRSITEIRKNFSLKLSMKIVFIIGRKLKDWKIDLYLKNILLILASQSSSSSSIPFSPKVHGHTKKGSGEMVNWNS